MKKYPQHIVVEIISEYWVKGLSQQDIADKITRSTTTRITQIELSQLLRDYGFSAQHGRNRGKLRYLQRNMSDNEIRAKLHTMIFGRNLRRIEEFERAFSSVNSSYIKPPNNPQKSNQNKSSENKDSSADSIFSFIAVSILSFILLNWFMSFPWWIDAIISMFAGTYISKKID